MSDYYLFRKYEVCALSQKRTLSRKNSSNFAIHLPSLCGATVKNQVFIINGSKVIYIYILNIFSF